MSEGSQDLIALDQCDTLDQLFEQRVLRSAAQPAYLHCTRDGVWHTLTWREAAREAARWRAGLGREGLQPGERVAMLLRNCPEWILFDQAALALGLVTVPLYNDDRAENATYILGHSGARVLLVQDAGRWSRLAQSAATISSLKRIIILEPSPAAKALATQDPRVRLVADWLPAGTDPAAKMSRTARRRDPHALATLVYTSGTTGAPKGVMLSHRNILGNVRAALTLFECHAHDRFLSFLPLSHTLERTAGYYLPMMAGASVAFARSIGQLAEDLQHIRPTVLIAVPRIFERVHARIADQLTQRPPHARWLFRQAVTVGWRLFEYRQGRANWSPALLFWPLLRLLVARRVLARLGGRLRVAVSGGAPLPFPVARAFIGLGLPLVQGYGLTETSPVISVNPLYDNRPQSVGLPLPGIELRFGEEQELWVRSDYVMLGYWSNPAATGRVLTADGWLRTGDQARLDGRHLSITGRLKDILVLSNGEKVPPADMEAAIAMDPLIEQALVIGEGRAYLTALLVLEAAAWTDLAATLGLDPRDPLSLQDPRLLKTLLQRVREALRLFPGYARIRRLTLTLEPWTIDNGLLTPTMKVKRAAVLERHRQVIDRMYAST